MAVVVTKFGVAHAPPINRLGAMQQGNALGPLTDANNKAAFFPHVQTSIGAAGQTRAIMVKTPIYPSTNHLF